MRCPIVVTAALALVGLIASHGRADQPEQTPKALDGRGGVTPPLLAARIDQLIEARWKEKKVTPAPLADDAAFIRRVYLDLAGRIPNILEVRDFLDDDRPNKRRIWVDQLLKGIRKNDQADTYSDHFAAVWRDWLLPPTGGRGRGLENSFEAWLRVQLKENAPYDQMVRAILLSQGGGYTSPQAFYQANQNRPDNLAAATARLFLGVKLECAQCHDDRSGGNWKREEFWAFAAFFANQRVFAIPDTGKTVPASFLGEKPLPEKAPGGRAALAEWVTAADNPYFARATVNRLWAYFFGIGLVDPVDEFGPHNPPSHPKLLDELAKQFTLNRFDLKHLIRSIVLSETYQRSSARTHPSQDDPRLFAKAAVRGLSAEQLFDSLAVAAEADDGGGRLRRPFGGFTGQPQSPREEFLNRFHDQRRGLGTETSILQALHLMNGPLTDRASSLDHNRTLATIADAAKISTERRVETLYLVVLTRKPTEEELKRVVKYVEDGGPTGDHRKALADVFWALLNSAEFRLNH